MPTVERRDGAALTASELLWELSTSYNCEVYLIWSIMFASEVNELSWATEFLFFWMGGFLEPNSMKNYLI